MTPHRGGTLLLNPACFMAALSLLVAAASPAQTPDPLRLSREQAIAEALVRNPALAVARAQMEEARANVVTAAAFADPTFAADVAGQSHVLLPSSRTGSDQSFGMTLPFPGKRALRRDVATADFRVAEFNLQQLRQQVASQAAQSYDAILVALRHRDDLQQSKELAADFVKKTQARFLGGTVARVDVVKAETDLAQAENDLFTSDRAIATARASLNRVLGRTGGAPLETTTTLEVPASIAEIESMETLAESSRPEIAALLAQQQGANLATKLAKEFWLPDINLSVARNAVAGTPTTFTSGVAIGIPLFFGQHQRGEVAAAIHREEELAASLADIRGQVGLDVQTAYTNASTSLRQAVFIRDHLLPQAREVFRVASVSYGLGGSSALDLLDAKRTLLAAESQYVDALGAANDALAALELAVGAPLPKPPAGEQHP
jgi:cobalt-zinc-cadmium efflux system outer membrane protein